MKSERSTQNSKRRSKLDKSLEHQFLTSVILQFSVFLKGIVKDDFHEEIPQLSEKETIATKEKATNGPSTPTRGRRPAPTYVHENKKIINGPERKASQQEEEPSQSISSCSEELPSEIPSIEEIYPEGYKQKPKPPPKITQDQSEEYHAASPKKIRRKRNRHRDPNRTSPKKPVSSFVHFYAARAKQLRRDHPEGVVGNLAKILSSQWKVLPQIEKVPFIKAAQQSLQTYYSQKQLEKQALKRKYSEQRKNNQKLQRQNKMIEEKQPQRFQKDLKPIIENKADQQKQKYKQSEIKQITPPKDLNEYSLDVDFLPNAKGPQNNTFVSRFNMFIRSNYEKFKGNPQELALQQWRRMTSEEKKIYGNMAKAQKRKLERIESQQIVEPQKIQERTRRRRSIPIEQEEYKPNLYRKSISKASPESKSSVPNDNKENGSDDQDLHLFNFQIEPRNVKLEPDRNCELRNYMQQEYQNGQHHNNSMEMINEEKSLNSSGNEEKNRNRSKIPPNFIEVNSNEEVNAIQNSIKQIRKRERRRQMQHEQQHKKQKNPVNAFLLYYHDTISQLQAQNAKLQGSQLVKKASSKWSELNELEKEYYISLAKQQRIKSDLNSKHAPQEQTIKRRTRRMEECEEL